MSTDLRMLKCKKCECMRAHIVPRANHILHFLLCVFTVGFWLPIWILCAMFPGSIRCSVCGRKKGIFG